MNPIDIKLRTAISLIKSPISIDYNSKIITIGSCFSDTIGRFLKENKFDCLVNPFGTLFNPISIFETIRGSILDKPYSENNVVQLNSGYVNYGYHSRFWAENQEELRESIGDTNSEFKEFLSSADVLIITLGTAWVHVLKEKGNIVANCHKQAKENFDKRLLSAKEIKDSFSELHKILPENLSIIFTVSPVRHTKEGLPENQLSKSILRDAIYQIQEDNSKIDYFPSYEIMIDDLRDYRFYKADLIHPNKTAIKYIENAFKQTYFDGGTIEIMKKWEKLNTNLKHKSFNPNSKENKVFLEKVLQDLDELSSQVRVKEEIDEIKERIKKIEQIG